MSPIVVPIGMALSIAVSSGMSQGSTILQITRWLSLGMSFRLPTCMPRALELPRLNRFALARGQALVELMLALRRGPGMPRAVVATAGALDIGHAVNPFITVM
jgi:hypothetical protein